MRTIPKFKLERSLDQYYDIHQTYNNLIEALCNMSSKPNKAERDNILYLATSYAFLISGLDELNVSELKFSAKEINSESMQGTRAMSLYEKMKIALPGTVFSNRKNIAKDLESINHETTHLMIGKFRKFNRRIYGEMSKGSNEPYAILVKNFMEIFDMSLEEAEFFYYSSAEEQQAFLRGLKIADKIVSDCKKYCITNGRPVLIPIFEEMIDYTKGEINGFQKLFNNFSLKYKNLPKDYVEALNKKRLDYLENLLLEDGNSERCSKFESIVCSLSLLPDKEVSERLKKEVKENTSLSPVEKYGIARQLLREPNVSFSNHEINQLFVYGLAPAGMGVISDREIVEKWLFILGTENFDELQAEIDELGNPYDMDLSMFDVVRQENIGLIYTGMATGKDFEECLDDLEVLKDAGLDFKTIKDFDFDKAEKVLNRVLLQSMDQQMSQ